MIKDQKVPINKQIALWLLLCCGMIFFMALLGAVTRLTQSGLSITDWSPLLGTIPPLTAADWDKAFRAYQAIPQYKILNSGMGLENFKFIYFWEWLHRLWGRMIGVAFFIPFIIFLFQKKIDWALSKRLLLILAFGFLQGFIGWFMVESGLTVRTTVSPLRLALHLNFALLIYALILWTAFDRWPLSPLPFMPERSLLQHGLIGLSFLILTIIWGAFVAGLQAGEAYNTWPLMDGEFFPSAALTLKPRFLNLYQNLALVQFVHRWLGPITFIVVTTWAYRLRIFYALSTVNKLSTLIFMAAFLQLALGLGTLLSHVNIILATLHQAGAILLLTSIIVSLRIITKKGSSNKEKRLKD